MKIYGIFVIKHYKFLSLNEHFLLLFHLNKEYVMLINLDLQGHHQNVMLKSKYLRDSTIKIFER
jgi:hypothetical protein